jgi:hypothetical protein
VAIIINLQQNHFKLLLKPTVMLKIKNILITVFTLIITQITFAKNTNYNSVNSFTNCGIDKLNDNNTQNDNGT